MGYPIAGIADATTPVRGSSSPELLGCLQVPELGEPPPLCPAALQ
jgi:hypothetical protein